ncbi:6397_t:CDS:2 [Entrophospora sp. SA101]|nr:6397_t:CDS:2 [Entrophospora sp. SA101]
MLKSKITAKRTCNAISVKLKKEICEYMMVHQNKDKWLNLVSDTIGLDKFCQCSTRFPEFDKAMQIWTAQMVSARMPLSDLILQRKGGFARGLNIENQIKCANGWIYKFKKRNGLHKIKYSGEANSAPLQILPEERSKLRFILSQYNEDIYNADEMGIFFRMLPNQTLSTGPISGYKKGRKTPNINLTNIRLIYIPSNTTAHLQPMDAGIIHSFKAKYKHEYCKYLIRHFDNGTYNQRDKLNVKEAIYFIAEAWNNVTETTIQNCWIKTGIFPNKYLNDEEIISLVQFEEMGENGNDSSLDEEIPLILKIGIVKLMEPKIQKSIYAYFEKKEC